LRVLRKMKHTGHAQVRLLRFQASGYRAMTSSNPSFMRGHAANDSVNRLFWKCACDAYR
jgi:hypothetical protein